MELLVLGLVATIGLASYALWQRARAAETPALPPAEERTPTSMQVGDVVQHLGADFLVEGVLTLAQDSEVGGGARLYRLVDGPRERFLYAAGAAEPLLLEEAHDPTLDAASDSVEHAGRHFRVREVAQATALRVGSVGESRGSGRVTVRQYAADGPTRLLVLAWSDHADLFVGERVPAHLFEILPGR
jgi:hypothetical protein